MFKRFVPAWLLDNLREIRGFKRWEGGDVPPVTGLVDVIFRNGWCAQAFPAGLVVWRVRGLPGDVVWYRPRPHNLG